MGVKLQAFLADTIAEYSSGFEDGVSPEAFHSDSSDLGLKRGGGGVTAGKDGEAESPGTSHLTALRGGAPEEAEEELDLEARSLRRRPRGIN